MFYVKSPKWLSFIFMDYVSKSIASMLSLFLSS